MNFYVGSQSHYVNHTFPIWQALPDEIRGVFRTRPGTAAAKRADELGIQWQSGRQFRSSELVLVAGYEDYRATRHTKVIFLNHGVGQTYFGDTKSAGLSSYSGGRARERTVLFLCPSERDALSNRQAYPDTPAIAVGVPYLDQFHNQPRGDQVAISFHCNINACPETRWAFPHYQATIADLARSNTLPLIGHSHPRATPHFRKWWGRFDVPFFPNWWDVLKLAGCYVIDNSSTGYEAAALGIPVVWLNAPWYRRETNHGLRFWDDVPGIQVDSPADLSSAINLAASTRDLPMTRAYDDVDGKSLVDGRATERAVEAICRLTDAS